MNSFLRLLLPRVLGIHRLEARQIEQRNTLAYLAFLAILQSKKYQDKRSLAAHGFKVYSQAEEDGVLHEIFRRIGTEYRTFTEIGVSHGRECNTRLLLRYGWRGTWIDGSRNFAKEIREFFAREIESGQLRFACEFVTRDNVNELIQMLDGGPGIDLLSLDIDGNDYYILEALNVHRPQAIVLEYNPVFAPPVKWIKDYDPKHCWQGGDDYSASLKSYELMLTRKGYGLVGCTLNGNNAFFVRSDLLGDHFMPDMSAEFHYEPQRFWLTHAFVSGH